MKWDKLKKFFVDHIDWATSPGQWSNIVLTEIVLVTIAVIFALLATWPGRIVALQLASSNQNFEITQKKLVEVKQVDNETIKPWFAPSYRAGWEEQYQSITQLLGNSDENGQYGAAYALIQGQSSRNPDRVATWVQIIEDRMNSANQIITDLEKQISDLQLERSNAQSYWNSVSLTRGTLFLDQTLTRLNAETIPVHLEKYTSPIHDRLSQAEVISVTVATSLEFIKQNLLLNENQQRGDPRLATDLLNTAFASNTQISQVLSWSNTQMGDLLVAYEQSGYARVNAQEGVIFAQSTISQTMANRNWSINLGLKKPQELYQQAYSYWVSATQTLSNPVRPENKIDYSLGFGFGLKSQDLSRQSVNEVNRLVGIADDTSMKIGDFQSLQMLYRNACDSAIINRTTLVSLHWSDNWWDVKDYIITADKEAIYAGSELELAKQDMLLSAQSFDSAQAHINNAIQSLQTGIWHCNSLSDLTKSLEKSRLATPKKLTQASSSVNAAYNNTQYITYTSSQGQKLLESASSHFSKAQQASDRQDWPKAISLADMAISEASDGYNTIVAAATATEVRHVEETREENNRLAAATQVAISATRNAEDAEAAATASARIIEQQSSYSSNNNNSSYSSGSSSGYGGGAFNDSSGDTGAFNDYSGDTNNAFGD